MELTLRLTRCWFSSNLFYRDFSKNMSMFNWCFVPQFIYRTWRLTTKRINNNELKWKHEVANSWLALLSGVDFFSEASQGNARSRLERSNVFLRSSLPEDWISSWMKLTTQTFSRRYTITFFFFTIVTRSWVFGCSTQHHVPFSWSKFL